MDKHRQPKSPLDYVRAYIAKSVSILQNISEEEIVSLIALLKEARDYKGQVLLCGNGGSATTATHLASELGKEASLGQPKRFRVLSLTDNISWLTSLANDLDYSQIFVEQLKNYGQAGDLLLAFSSSGNSVNVLEAVTWANENKLITIGITGANGGKLAKLSTHSIHVASNHTGHIQEGHFLIQHLISYYFLETNPQLT